MKYLCLAYEEEHKLDALTRDEWDNLRQETLDYVENLARSGRLLVTHALQSVRNATTVRVRHGRLSATDGPFGNEGESRRLLPDRSPRPERRDPGRREVAFGSLRQYRGASDRGSVARGKPLRRRESSAVSLEPI